MPHYSTLVLFTAAVLAAPTSRLAAADYYVYYGTANGGAGNGISLGHFDTATGVLTKPQLAAQAEGPSFFVLAADGKHLYACLESGNQVGAYAIDGNTGALKLLNTLPAGGSGPCHISLDKTGHYAFVANYNSGSLSVFSIKPDGSFGAQTGADQHKGTGPDTSRQEGPHAHCIIADPTNRFVLCTDLGNDRVYIYKFNEKDGTITANDPAFATVKGGSGPRHLLFHPNGKVLYLINEMGGTITAFNWDSAKGALNEFQTVATLPADFKGTNTNAELAISPNQKFLYASTRGHDSIVVYSIDPKTFALSQVQDISSGGKFPRYYSFDPSGKWIIAGNQNTSNAVVFSVDDKTGKLTPHGNPLSAPSPICMAYLPVPAGTDRVSPKGP